MRPRSFIYHSHKHLDGWQICGIHLVHVLDIAENTVLPLSVIFLPLSGVFCFSISAVHTGLILDRFMQCAPLTSYLSTVIPSSCALCLPYSALCSVPLRHAMPRLAALESDVILFVAFVECIIPHILRIWLLQSKI